VVGQRVDFSGNAALYDRRHGALLSADTVRELAAIGNLPAGARVLDIGAGTGRAAIAFHSLDYRTVALDPALAMLDELRRKGSGSIAAVAAEGARLPFPASAFDAVILARILYLLPDWEIVLRQVSRVLRPGGSLLHEWGNGQPGEPWVRIREKARALFEEAGVIRPFHPGARSEGEADVFLTELGFTRSAELELGPGPQLTLRAFLDRIVSGEVSYIWSVPEAVRSSCLPVLREWCEDTFDLEQSFPAPAELRWAVYRKTA
jgi:SAM-dependent methyltransferase